jgi:hypothetical protein
LIIMFKLISITALTASTTVSANIGSSLFGGADSLMQRMNDAREEIFTKSGFTSMVEDFTELYQMVTDDP